MGQSGLRMTVKPFGYLVRYSGQILVFGFYICQVQGAVNPSYVIKNVWNKNHVIKQIWRKIDKNQRAKKSCLSWNW